MYLSRPLKRRRPHKTRADRTHSPGIHPDVAEGLADLAYTARAVTRHSAPGSPEVMARELLNATLASLNARKVPVEELARATGINHQAIRRRISEGNPKDGLFTSLPETVDPHAALGGTFHYYLTPTGSNIGKFTIREINGDVLHAGVPVLSTPYDALQWLNQQPPYSLSPVRTSGEILSVVFAIDPGELTYE
jgi:hypothetical protein